MKELFFFFHFSEAKGGPLSGRRPTAWTRQRAWMTILVVKDDMLVVEDDMLADRETGEWVIAVIGGFEVEGFF